MLKKAAKTIAGAVAGIFQTNTKATQPQKRTGMPHQGAREMARRRRQMAKAAAK